MMKKHLLIVCTAICCSAVSCFAAKPDVDAPAPAFKVVSGDKQTLTLDELKGKVVVLFYEAKRAVEQNRNLKNVLNRFYERQPQDIKNDIARVGVIDCQGVLFRGAWESGLRGHSVKEGITVYGDWDGKMGEDYDFNTDESNVIVIDRKGMIRYRASGPLKDEDIDSIERLLEGLVKEA